MGNSVHALAFMDKHFRHIHRPHPLPSPFQTGFASSFVE